MYFFSLNLPLPTKHWFLVLGDKDPRINCEQFMAFFLFFSFLQPRQAERQLNRFRYSYNDTLFSPKTDLTFAFSAWPKFPQMMLNFFQAVQINVWSSTFTRIFSTSDLCVPQQIHHMLSNLSISALPYKEEHFQGENTTDVKRDSAL